MNQPLRHPLLNVQKPTDFFVDVEGVGRFRFNRHTYGAKIKISATMARILGPGGAEAETDAAMSVHASVVSMYSALVSDCPLGWEDLEAIDLTEAPERENQIVKVWMALQDKLDSFRLPRVEEASKSAGEGVGEVLAPNDAVPGAQPLQAAAERPEVAGA